MIGLIIGKLLARLGGAKGRKKVTITGTHGLGDIHTYEGQAVSQDYVPVMKPPGADQFTPYQPPGSGTSGVFKRLFK